MGKYKEIFFRCWIGNDIPPKISKRIRQNFPLEDSENLLVFFDNEGVFNPSKGKFGKLITQKTFYERKWNFGTDSSTFIFKDLNPDDVIYKPNTIFSEIYIGSYRLSIFLHILDGYRHLSSEVDEDFSLFLK